MYLVITFESQQKYGIRSTVNFMEWHLQRKLLIA